ncbi:hypothetical protein Cni_G18431 [Canna indica]|uniref:Uncharacterized protein n=1 Tax=Canna indica TaxID=4628 RepID=A0AAQ3KIV0_9LILI|nr:hypothetical protein Cni_G18431 [Canna indica]
MRTQSISLGGSVYKKSSKSTWTVSSQRSSSRTIRRGAKGLHVSEDLPPRVVMFPAEDKVVAPEVAVVKDAPPMEQHSVAIPRDSHCFLFNIWADLPEGADPGEHAQASCLRLAGQVNVLRGDRESALKVSEAQAREIELLKLELAEMKKVLGAKVCEVELPNVAVLESTARAREVEDRSRVELERLYRDLAAAIAEGSRLRTEIEVALAEVERSKMMVQGLEEKMLLLGCRFWDVACRFWDAALIMFSDGFDKAMEQQVRYDPPLSNQVTGCPCYKVIKQQENSIDVVRRIPWMRLNHAIVWWFFAVKKEYILSSEKGTPQVIHTREGEGRKTPKQFPGTNQQQLKKDWGEELMPKTSSSPSPTITPMNPTIKPQPIHSQSHQTLAPNHPPPPPAPISAVGDVGDAVDLLHSFHHDHHHQPLLMDDEDDDPNPHPSGTLAHSQSPFSSLLRDDDDEDEEPEDEDEIEPEEALIEERKAPSSAATPPPLDEASATVPQSAPRIDPAPHVSSQFYTFNPESHRLMISCILDGRLATPEEIRAATPWSVLKSWRTVWKDRNEDTAYLTAWKRLQDKLQVHMDGHLPALFFKSNPVQRVSHVDQWQDIVTAAHADPDLLRHLGLKETIDRIKQSWTVGAKFYGIPESFIRVCVSSCPACSSASSLTSPGGSTLSRSKRRRFEYTESFEVPAKDVQRRLQQLAAKYKVVLCIRQKYIRYKPFMAEVKDYACHRAGEPSSAAASAKKARVLKREPYQSKRCGCGFRIRAIVPITDYNEKEKTFVYQEEGNAIFKLYAIHTGHEPGPLDGNARIIHRAVGNKGAFEFDQEIYGVREDVDSEPFCSLMSKDDIRGDSRHIVLQQVKDLKVEAGMLEARIAKMDPDIMNSLSQELSDILHRLRGLGGGLQHSEEALGIGDDEIVQWGNEGNHHLHRHDRIFSKDSEMIEEEHTDFGSDLGAIVPWDRMAADCQDRKMLMKDSLKPDKWMLKEHCSDFDEKSILNCSEDEESKLIKPLTDSSLVGMQVDGFYADSTKWYDSPGGLDPSTDSLDGGFRHGGIV